MLRFIGLGPIKARRIDSVGDRQGEPGVPLEAVEARRLYRQVADQLRALIDSGEYRVGSRLPTERDLAEQLKVSRPTVREALIALEVEGRERIRVGSGIYVIEPAAGWGAPPAFLLPGPLRPFGGPPIPG